MNYKFTLPKRNRPIYLSIEEFEFEKKIGEGTFSKVYKSIHRATKKIYAIKVVDFGEISVLDQENIEKEIRAHKEFNHKNIVRLYDYFMEKNKVYLVLEYCAKGNLYKFVMKKQKLTEKEIHFYFRQALEGISYLHRKGYINRDIKPENILIDENLCLKLCDFGWASHISDENYRKLVSGTISYMSPECIKNQPQDFKSDVYSLGVLLFRLYHGKEPFKAGSVSNQLGLILQNEIPFNKKLITAEAQEIIKSMMSFEKEDRPDIYSILANRFFFKRKKNKTEKGSKSGDNPKTIKAKVKELKLPKKIKDEFIQKQDKKKETNIKTVKSAVKIKGSTKTLNRNRNTPKTKSNLIHNKLKSTKNNQLSLNDKSQVKYKLKRQLIKKDQQIIKQPEKLTISGLRKQKSNQIAKKMNGKVLAKEFNKDTYKVKTQRDLLSKTGIINFSSADTKKIRRARSKSIVKKTKTQEKNILIKKYRGKQ